MEERLFFSMPADKRAQMIRDNADEIIPDDEYFREATKSELNEARHRITDLAIELSKLDQRRKDILAELKEEREPVAKDYKDTLSLLRLKGRQVKEDLFKYIDQEAGEVGFYNGAGQLISQRRAFPDERQTRIRSISNS